MAERDICIVDDDEATRDALVWLLATRNLQAVAFASAQALLEAWDPERFACLVLDIRMPGQSGLALFETLRQQGGYCPPVIFLTGHGDVPMAVDALKHGAADFIEKPFNDNLLVDRVEHLLTVDVQARQRWQSRKGIDAHLARLTPREYEVMGLILLGRLNKVIADDLNISMKTVEVHRARILEKMGVKTAVELAALIGTLDTRRP